MAKAPNGARILLLDIETAPNVVHVWGLYDQNVGINQIMAAGYVMCWAAKWLDVPGVLFSSVFEDSPTEMLTKMHELLDQADIVVHYNGDKFDVPTLNKEFITHKLAPPAPYKSIDLLKVARRQFRFPSNKLDYIAQALGEGSKVKHAGHSLWIGCMNGDEKAWRTMKRYNKGDVVILERVYKRMLPWIKNHPNVAMFVDHDRPICTNCGSSHVERRGLSSTISRQYVRFQCKACQTWMRGNTPLNKPTVPRLRHAT